MQGFTEKIVGMMKSENLFASQGGPIILSQASIIVWCQGLYGWVTAYGYKQMSLVASTSC